MLMFANRRSWFLTLAILGVTCWGVATSPAVAAPNVLFIAIDDLNDWIGCLGGHPQVRTPNIDRLAARGVLFTNAHCAAPACNPSRAAVFSGRMAYHTGVWSNSSRKLTDLQPDLLLLPSAFKRAGYVTLGTGKLLHGGASRNAKQFDRNFYPEQRWSPFLREEVRYADGELASKGTSNPRHVVRRPGRAEVVLPFNRMPSDRNPTDPDGESFDWGPVAVPDAEMGDAQIADWAIEQIAKGFDKPFFMGVGFYRPHIPLWAPQQYFDWYPDSDVQLPPYREDDLADLSPSARRWALEAVTAGSHSTVVRHRQWPAAVSAYLACVSFVDHHVGRLLDALDDSNYAENTVVVLWSDHGWHLGEKQHWGKWTGWERSTRVPLIVVPPKDQAADFASAGARCAEPTSLIDLYPTLLEICGVEQPAGLDGLSLVPLLHNPQTSSGRTVVTTFDRGNVSLRSGRWRYVRYADESEELYDHRADSNEWTNLAGDPDHAERLRAMRRQLPPAAISANP